MSPELLSIYRKKVAYGEDPREVEKYIDKLEKSRLKTSLDKDKDTILSKVNKYIEKSDKQKYVYKEGHIQGYVNKCIDELNREPPLKKQRIC
jgi:hypothetical protein